MSATNNFETSLLKLIFNNDNLTGIADGLSSAGELYLSLHTADPGEAGNQATSEATYTDYVRVSTNRNTSDWTVLANEVSNAIVQSFPIASGGSSMITHFGIGLSPTGPGTLLLYGALDTSLAVSPGIRPIFDIGDLKVSVE